MLHFYQFILRLIEACTKCCVAPGIFIVLSRGSLYACWGHRGHWRPGTQVHVNGLVSLLAAARGSIWPLSGNWWLQYSWDISTTTTSSSFFLPLSHPLSRPRLPSIVSTAAICTAHGSLLFCFCIDVYFGWLLLSPDGCHHCAGFFFLALIIFSGLLLTLAPFLFLPTCSCFIKVR